MKVALAAVLGALLIAGLLMLAVPRPTLTMTLSNGGDPALWPGQTLTGTINVISINGFAGVVTLSAQVIPAPIAGSLIVSFSPATAAVSPTSPLSTTLTIAASSSVTAGQYTLILTGESSGIVHSIEVGLTINPLVSFYSTGLDNQVSGNILEVNGTYYSYSAVASGLIVRQAYGEPLVYNWLSPVSSGSGNVYAWKSTAGLATTQNATVIDYASGSISANYVAESLSTVTFTESNLPSGTTWGVTVNDNHYTTTAGNPITVTDVTLGSAYAYDTPLATGQNTEYTCACTGTVSAASINGAYQPQYYVTIGSSPSGTGTVSPSSGWFVGGAVISLTASGTSQYGFTDWTETGSITLQNANNAQTTATINGPGTITANFVELVQITFQQSGIGSDSSGTVLTVDGTQYTAAQLPQTFTWATGSSHTYSWSSLVAAGSGKQYAWQSTSGLVTSQSGTIIPSTGGTVTGNYITQYQLTVAVSPPNTGTTSPAVGVYWENSGTQVTITANPASGYQFSNWSGSGTGAYTGSNNPASVTMSSPITETANFATLPPFNIDSVNECSGRYAGCTLTLTTLSAGDFIFIDTWGTTAPTDSKNIAPTVRIQGSFDHIYYFQWTGSGTISVTCYGFCIAFAVAGVTGFDPNTSVPAISTSNAVSISTTDSHDLILSFCFSSYSANNGCTYYPYNGFALIGSTNAGNTYTFGVAYKIVSSPQSNLQVGWYLNVQEVTGDALT